MAAPLFPAGCARSAEDFHTVAGLRAWLERGVDWRRSCDLCHQ